MVMAGRLCEAATAVALGIVMMGVSTLLAPLIDDPGVREAWRMRPVLDADALTIVRIPAAAGDMEAVANAEAPRGADGCARLCELIDALVHRQLSQLGHWLQLMNVRLRLLGDVVAMAIPVGLAWWMVGRRQAFQALAQGIPVRDATRVRWIRLSAAIAMVLGAVTAHPRTAQSAELMAVLVIAACGALSRTRASSAAALDAVEPA
jgi:hypothetical protein